MLGMSSVTKPYPKLTPTIHDWLKWFSVMKLECKTHCCRGHYTFVVPRVQYWGETQGLTYTSCVLHHHTTIVIPSPEHCAVKTIGFYCRHVYGMCTIRKYKRVLCLHSWKMVLFVKPSKIQLPFFWCMALSLSNWKYHLCFVSLALKNKEKRKKERKRERQARKIVPFKAEYSPFLCPTSPHFSESLINMDKSFLYYRIPFLFVNININ